METIESAATGTSTGATAQANTGALLGTTAQPTVSVEQAKAEIATLRNDKTFTARLLSKDPAANVQWTRLHEAAFPESADEALAGSSAVQPKVQPNAATQPTQQNADGLDDATVFAPPSSPAGYRFDRLPHGVQHDLQQEQFIRESFFAADIPQGIAGQLNRMFTAAMLTPPDATALEVSRQQAHIQLERVHGAHTAKVIEIARKEFAAAVARPGGERLVALIEKSGLGNSPYLVTSLYNIARSRGRA